MEDIGEEDGEEEEEVEEEGRTNAMVIAIRYVAHQAIVQERLAVIHGVACVRDGEQNQLDGTRDSEQNQLDGTRDGEKDKLDGNVKYSQERFLCTCEVSGGADSRLIMLDSEGVSAVAAMKFASAPLMGLDAGMAEGAETGGGLREFVPVHLASCEVRALTASRQPVAE
eukprot:764585-Hanusia_phi.AAC.2